MAYCLFFFLPAHTLPLVEGATSALLDLDYLNTFDNLTTSSPSASNMAASTWIISTSKYGRRACT
jgi:hypothetical protein